MCYGAALDSGSLQVVILTRGGERESAAVVQAR